MLHLLGQGPEMLLYIQEQSSCGGKMRKETPLSPWVDCFIMIGEFSFSQTNKKKNFKWALKKKLNYVKPFIK